jgi:hypothetical protein
MAAGTAALTLWLFMLGLSSLLISRFYSLQEFAALHFSSSAIVFFVSILLLPILSLLFYKKEKTEFYSDFTVLALLVFLLMVAFVHFCFVTRPVAYVFSVDRVVLVTADRISLDEIPVNIYENDIKNSFGLIYAEPIDKHDADLIFKVMAGEPDIEYRPSRYLSAAGNRKEILSRGLVVARGSNSSIQLPLFVHKQPVGLVDMSVKDFRISKVKLR